jgi:helix-turn-helix protein/tetratricopeptide repeat protein
VWYLGNPGKVPKNHCVCPAHGADPEFRQAPESEWGAAVQQPEPKDAPSSTDPRQVLGRRLRRLRKSAGLNLEDLVDAVERSTSTLSALEKGQFKHSPDQMVVQSFIAACEMAEGGDRAVVAAQAAAARTAFEVVSGLQAMAADNRPRAAAPSIVGRIPHPVDGFQERAAGLGDDDPIVVIVGLGGVGKTQLAAGYARGRVASRDIDLVVWVDASSKDAIISRYAEAGIRFAKADPDQPQQAAERFLDWLETTPQRWLIVLDNLGHSNGAALWPPTRNPAGRTIATARPRHAAIVGRGRRVIELDVFTESEAEAYLRHGLPEQLADDVAGVAEDLGRLPLALGQAAAYILDQDIPYSEYRRRFADHRNQRLADLVPEPGELPDGHLDPVAFTWVMSIEAADRGRPAGLARPVLELASMLDPDAFPTAVFTTEAVVNWLTHTTGAAQDVDATTVYAALRRLHLFSLASVDTETVRVHTLVQRAVRDDLPEERFADVAWAAADALAGMWPENGVDPDLNQRLRASTEALNRYAGDHLWAADGFHRVLLEAGKSRGHAGRAGVAAAYFGELLTAAEQRLGPDHPATTDARQHLAIWQTQAGDPAGLDTARRVVEDRSRRWGRNHPETHHARHTLGIALEHFGDPQTAVTDLESLLADRTRLVPPDHEASLILRHNLAKSRGEAGDPAAAVAELVAVLADTVRVHGPDHPETLSTRHELARWRSIGGDPARAAVEFEQIVADRQRVLGPRHHETLLSTGELAITKFLAGGDAGVAVIELESLLAVHQEQHGLDHPDTLETRAKIIAIRAQEGPAPADVPAAEALLDDILRALGPRHAHAPMAAELVASVRNDEPLTGPNELLAGCLRVLGPDHPSIWLVRAETVRARLMADDRPGVVTALEGLVDDLTRLHGPDHSDPLLARSKLAEARARADDLPGAIRGCTELLADRLRILGPDHPETLMTRSALAGYHDAAGDPTSAAEAHEELLAGLLRTVGPEHENTLGTRNNVARKRGDAGDRAGAAAAFERLLADCIRILGPDHPCTALVRENLEHFQPRTQSTV